MMAFLREKGFRYGRKSILLLIQSYRAYGRERKETYRKGPLKTKGCLYLAGTADELNIK